MTSHEAQVIDEVDRILKEQGPFDVIVTNLQLEKESDDPDSEPDDLGERILAHVTKHYPGIHAIVFTGFVPPDFSGLGSSYNAYLVVKDVSHKADLVCEKIVDFFTRGLSGQAKYFWARLRNPGYQQHSVPLFAQSRCHFTGFRRH